MLSTRNLVTLVLTTTATGVALWFLIKDSPYWKIKTPEVEDLLLDPDSDIESDDKENEEECDGQCGCGGQFRGCGNIDVEEVSVETAVQQGIAFNPQVDVIPRVIAFQEALMFSDNETEMEGVTSHTGDSRTNSTSGDKFDLMSCVADVPEHSKVYVKTFGCSHNMSDSEFMSGLLKQAGFDLVQRWELCDIAVLNSCTVKNPSQDGAVNLAKKVQAAGKKVVVAGCVVQADRKIKDLQNVSSIGVKQLEKVVEAVTETLKGNVYIDVSSNRDLPQLMLPKVRRNELIEIVPLSTGCLGSCTYCKTKHARGDLGSYRPEAILERIKSAIEEGVQQIWLTSEDTGAYGIDIGTNIADLLESIANVVVSTKSKHHVMVRLGMTNPPYILAHLDRLARVLESPHFFEFLHLPVQSGSNKILLDMHREYTREEFELCADRLKAQLPYIHLSTDFICGFPDETDEDHAESMSLIKKYMFPSLNISQFYPRPGTPAALMKRVKTQVVKARSQEMTRLFYSYSTLEPMLGMRAKVWFTEVSDKSPHTVGHTKQYVKVLVPLDLDLIGTERICEFTDCSKWHLNGVVINEGDGPGGHASAVTSDHSHGLLSSD